MRYLSITGLLLLTWVAVNLVHAEGQRHHEAHEHGGGELNVAVEQHTLMIDLSLPAMNVVGFEHPVNDESERDQVAKAVDLLRDGMRLFVPTPAAKCALVRAEVESVLLENVSHHEHDEKHDEEEHAHADFDVSYELNCKAPEQLYTLTLWLFQGFPGTQHLRTQVIMSTSQTGVDLTAANNVLKLK